MSQLKQTKEGVLIPQEVIGRLPSQDLSMIATGYYVLIQPKNMAQVTKGMLKEKEALPDVDNEVYQLFEERNR